MGRRRTGVVPAAATVAAFALAAALSLSLLLSACSANGSSSAAVGKPAPAVAARDLDGKPVNVRDLRGSPVLLNFWASWCVPCKGEFPVLQKGLSDHPDLKVVGVVFNDSAGSARKFVADQHATWPSVTDPGAKIASAYHVAQKPGIPVSVLIGADGLVRATHLGPFSDAAELDGFLATPSGT